MVSGNVKCMVFSLWWIVIGNFLPRVNIENPLDGLGEILDGLGGTFDGLACGDNAPVGKTGVKIWSSGIASINKIFYNHDEVYVFYFKSYLALLWCKHHGSPNLSC